MQSLQVVAARTAQPTGDPDFTVLQCFPAVIPSEQTDPFLMCDEFGPKPSEGTKTDPDEYPVDWHPHLGFDICTYLREGTGRHADSMGNRGCFSSPGFQWISVGSGIEHAEGGGTPKGVNVHGFQLWVNVPRVRKDDDPSYGVGDHSNIPVHQYDGSRATCRVIAGCVTPPDGPVGPFRSVQNIQILDLEVEAHVSLTHHVPSAMHTCLLYVYRGEATIADQTRVPEKHICRLNASADAPSRDLVICAGARGLGALLFAGVPVREPIAWRGPFVMSTQAELDQAFAAYRAGKFPPKRVPWNYKRYDAMPEAHRQWLQRQQTEPKPTHN